MPVSDSRVVHDVGFEFECQNRCPNLHTQVYQETPPQLEHAPKQPKTQTKTPKP